MTEAKSPAPKPEKPAKPAKPDAVAATAAVVLDTPPTAPAAPAAPATPASATDVAVLDPAAAPALPVAEPLPATVTDPEADQSVELWSVYGRRCQAAVDVLKERCRQVEGEGFEAELDDVFTDYQLPRAAICYAIKAAGLPDHRATLYWPFAASVFKPTDRRGSLVKAAALLLAEIERLDRAEQLAD